MRPLRTAHPLSLLLVLQFVLLSSSQCTCGARGKEDLMIAVIPWMMGTLLFLISQKNLTLIAIASPDWFLSFLCLAFLTILLGDTVATVLWGGHYPAFEYRTLTPITKNH